MSDFALQRRMMVDGQLRTFDITNPAILAAMGAVPRERFVAPAQRAVAYVDRELPMVPDEPRLMLTPMAFARLLQSAEITPEDSVLDVGCGAGFSAAVLARVARTVTALEEAPRLFEAAHANLAGLGCVNVALVRGELDRGWAANAPYDVIVLEGAIEVEPTALLDQLRPGGRLVAVWGLGRTGRATVWRKSGRAVGSLAAFDTVAPPLPRFGRKPEFSF